MAKGEQMRLSKGLLSVKVGTGRVRIKGEQMKLSKTSDVFKKKSCHY